MRSSIFASYKREPFLILAILFLLLLSIITLRSIAGFVFPYYFVYVVIAILSFIFFSQIDFEILRSFSSYFYILSVFSLLLTLVIGEVTRGATRWIQIGPWTIQPTEMIRPFLFIFFSDFLAKQELTLKRFVRSLVYLFIPVVLILLQPSLGVAVLLLIGFVGIMFSLNFNKKVLLSGLAIFLLFAPLSWFILAPYQRLRVKALLVPSKDPYGAGYNSIQSMISVGSGRLIGRGLGEGVQTQLYFLPERYTDFIFASISEETGLLGAGLTILGIFFVLYRIIAILGKTKDVFSRAFASGVFLTLFSQVIIHIGMNLGVVPITGVPLPLVSAGGSSLVATMITLGIITRLERKDD